jgi:hypothetical protein
VAVAAVVEAAVAVAASGDVQAVAVAVLALEDAEDVEAASALEVRRLHRLRRMCGRLVGRRLRRRLLFVVGRLQLLLDDLPAMT